MNTLEPTLAPLPAALPLDAATASRNRLVISLLLLSVFIVILNETIMGVALPRLMHDLAITAGAAQWLTTAFLFTMAIVIPITGFLLQRYNTRPIYITAMASFSIGTFIAALAPGLAVLIVGRVIQAVGTAILMPLLMTTVMTLVPAESRGKTMGNLTVVISVAPAIGPTLSGVILSFLGWRWMFLLVLPIALGALLLGSLRIVNVTTPRATPLDLLSVGLSVLGFGGLVYGLSNLGGSAAGPVSGAQAFVLGAVGLVLFVLRQRSLEASDGALLDLRTFNARTFSICALLMAICMMALLGTLILLPIYMQNVLGYNTLKTGLLLLPGGLIMGLLSPSIGRCYDKHGPTVLVVPGTLLMCGALWGMATVNAHTSFVWLLVAHITLSVGLAMTFTPLFSASLGALAPELYSHGSALLGTIQQVSGAAGTALFVALMSKQATSLLARGMSQVQATTGGIRVAFLWSAIISIFAVVAAFFVKKPPESAPLNS